MYTARVDGKRFFRDAQAVVSAYEVAPQSLGLSGKVVMSPPHCGLQADLTRGPLPAGAGTSADGVVQNGELRLPQECWRRCTNRLLWPLLFLAF